VGTAIVLAISNLLVMWLTARITFRVATGRNLDVLPTWPTKVSVENDDEQNGQEIPVKGRPVL
jgi:hypothetical protein